MFNDYAVPSLSTLLIALGDILYYTVSGHVLDRCVVFRDKQKKKKPVKAKKIVDPGFSIAVEFNFIFRRKNFLRIAFTMCFGNSEHQMKYKISQDLFHIYNATVP